MEGSILRFDRSEALYERAQRVIPGGVPGIRGPDNFVRGAYPVLLAKGRGGQVVDVDGNVFVDLLLGYGPVVLGHAEAEVDRAAQARAADGSGASRADAYRTFDRSSLRISRLARLVSRW